MTLKKLAAKASLQRLAKIPSWMHRIYSNGLNKILRKQSFFSVRRKLTQKSRKNLKLDSANQSIPGTLKYHAFIPNENSQLQLKKFSFATEFDLFSKKAVTHAVQKTQKTQKNKKETNNLDYFEL